MFQTHGEVTGKRLGKSKECLAARDFLLRCFFLCILQLPGPPKFWKTASIIWRRAEKTRLIRELSPETSCKMLAWCVRRGAGAGLGWSIAGSRSCALSRHRCAELSGAQLAQPPPGLKKQIKPLRSRGTAHLRVPCLGLRPRIPATASANFPFRLLCQFFCICSWKKPQDLQRGHPVRSSTVCVVSTCTACMETKRIYWHEESDLGLLQYQPRGPQTLLSLS